MFEDFMDDSKESLKDFFKESKRILEEDYPFLKNVSVDGSVKMNGNININDKMNIVFDELHDVSFKFNSDGEEKQPEEVYGEYSEVNDEENTRGSR